MKNTLFTLGFLFISFFSYSQLKVTVKGGDFEVCSGDSVTLESEIISGTPTSFTWISSVGTFATSASSTTKALFSNSGSVILKTEDGSNTAFDTVQVTVNSLPQIVLKRGIFCQDVDEFQLKNELVQIPATYLGTPLWKCLECNGNDFSDMLNDKSNSGGITNFWLDVSDTSYTLKNAERDTVVLEFSYTNQYGCVNKDTTEIEIWRVPKISFSSMRDLCWNEGEISLNALTSVNITNGTWYAINASGYDSAAYLGGILSGDTINTRNSVETKPNTKKWLIRYYHDATGCPVWRDTILTIHPRPVISLTALDRQPALYCENDLDISLNASPNGGTWSASDTNALQNKSYFSPSKAAVHEIPIWLNYTYTAPNTGCISIDSLEAVVHLSPTIKRLVDTILVRPTNQIHSKFDIEVELKNYNSSYVIPIGPKASNAQAYLKNGDSILEVNFTHIPNRALDTFLIYLAVERDGPCPSVDNIFEIIVSTDSTYAHADNLHLNFGVELYPNPSSGIFKLGNLNPAEYAVSIFDKCGKFHGLLEADVNGNYSWFQSGLFLVVAEHKQSKQRITLRLLSL